MNMKRQIMLCVCALCAALTVVGQEPATSRIDRSMNIYYDVMRELDMYYADTLDYETLTETSINQMLRHIDPYTVYYPKKKDKDLRMLTTGKYGGIGSIIQLHPDETEGKKDTSVVIANPYEGKPAQRAGVQAGDVIVSVDDWQARGQSVSDVSDHLRGEPGTTLQLRVLREGTADTLCFSIVREDIHLDPIEYTYVFDSVGYIALSEFTEGSGREFQIALYHLAEQGARSLIVDLRGNGGGLVDEAVNILSNFVPKGTEVVSMRGKDGANARSYSTTALPLYPDMPLVVLVDHNSASASEIVSGALQDLKRATLIGERTFGKGLVQNIRPINYGGHLKVTTARYYLPSGRCIQAIDYAERQRGNQLHRDTAGGILPDIVLTDSQKVDICYELYAKNMFFDYATLYHRTHDSIADPRVFELTDKEIEAFCDWLETRKFTYTTETSKYYHDVLEMAKNEDLDEETLRLLTELEPRLKPDFREAIRRNQDEVKRYLGAEIVLRYWYQKGNAAFMLRYDKVLTRAIEELRTNQSVSTETVRE